jgi:hypothetical protein
MALRSADRFLLAVASGFRGTRRAWAEDIRGGPLNSERGCEERLAHSAPKIDDVVWAEIDRAFSEPVTKNDDSDAYAPTQTLVELFLLFAHHTAPGFPGGL